MKQFQKCTHFSIKKWEARPLSHRPRRTFLSHSDSFCHMIKKICTNWRYIFPHNQLGKAHFDFWLVNKQLISSRMRIQFSGAQYVNTAYRRFCIFAPNKEQEIVLVSKQAAIWDCLRPTLPNSPNTFTRAGKGAF